MTGKKGKINKNQGTSWKKPTERNDKETQRRIEGLDREKVLRRLRPQRGGPSKSSGFQSALEDSSSLT